MIAFAFLLSCLFRSSRTAIVSGFLYVFATGLIGQQLLATFIDNGAWWLWLVELIPGFALFRCAHLSIYACCLCVYNCSGGACQLNWRCLYRSATTAHGGCSGRGSFPVVVLLVELIVGFALFPL